VGILDVNRLGQSRETMAGHNVLSYEEKFRAFGWETAVIDGHNFAEIRSALAFACESKDKPTMIIAKTIKGKGVSFIEDKEGWHGKALSADELTKALKEIGETDKSLLGMIAKPEAAQAPSAKSREPNKSEVQITNYEKPTATRKAYGNALVNAFGAFPDMVVLDGETSNSTFAETFRKAHPDKYFEMFIAEQNMIGTAAGLARRGKIPFVSTFAAFFSRAYDQIRMAQYGNLNIKLCGSHAGVSIGEDGASQMGLEDLAMFRTLIGSTVLYPSDAVSAEKLVALAAEHRGLVYIRTTRKDTAVLYSSKNQEAGSKAGSLKEEGSERVEHDFKIGGSCTLRSSENDQATVIGAGVTLHEALAAYEDLKKEGISIRVVDLYSIKPIDAETIRKAAVETRAIITVEDHHQEGGLGEAVLYGLAELAGAQARVHILAVKKEPKSGKPDELLAYEEINKDAIIKKVKEVI
jgi:transketolase